MTLRKNLVYATSKICTKVNNINFEQWQFELCNIFLEHLIALLKGLLSQNLAKFLPVDFALCIYVLDWCNPMTLKCWIEKSNLMRVKQSNMTMYCFHQLTLHYASMTWIVQGSNTLVKLKLISLLMMTKLWGENTELYHSG